jgi:O-antigen/teichoic acid export membrane protein
LSNNLEIEPQEESLGAKIRKNTRAALLTFFWGQFIMTVRMLVLFQYLEPEGYALWVFAFSISTYFTIYNFGIANAFVKYTAELHTHREYTRLNGLISTGMAIAVGFGLIVAVLLLLFTEQAVNFFNVSAQRHDEAEFVVIGIGLTSAFHIAFNAYPAILTGIHKLYVVNYCRVGVLTVEITLTFIALVMGQGLITVMWLYMAGVVCSNLLTAYFAHKNLPQLRIAPWLASWRDLKEMLNLGSRLQLLGVVALFVSSLDILVFMKYGSEAMVGLYAIAQRVAERGQGIARQGFGALAPASAELLSREAVEKARHVYDTANRFTALITVYVFAYMAFNADFIMRFVMDEQYDELSVWIFQWLALANAVHSITGAGSSMLRGAGAPMRETIYQALIGIFFVCSFYPLHEFWGNTSTQFEESFRHELLLTWPFALIGGSTVFIFMANRFFKAHLFSPLDRMLLVVLAGCFLAWLVDRGWHWLGIWEPTGRWDALVVVGITGSVYTIAFALATWFLPGLTDSDRDQLRRFLPGANRFLPRRES